jgi:hypothetical protein
MDIKEVLSTPESESMFKTNYSRTVARQVNTTEDAVEVLNITAGSIIVDSRILVLEAEDVQAMSTQLTQTATVMSEALATTFDLPPSAVRLDNTSIVVEILVSPPPPTPPPVPPPLPVDGEDAGMNIGLIAGGAAAGGVVLLIGVAIGMYCRGKRDAGVAPNVHVVTHDAPTANPLPGAPQPYPTPAQHPSAYPTDNYAPSTYGRGQVQFTQ